MKILGINIGSKKRIEPVRHSDPKLIPEADFFGAGSRSYPISLPYTGEKNLGEMGPPRMYYSDFYTLRIRSWQSFFESDITQTVIKKFIIWSVGSGLRLRCEPEVDVLRMMGVNAPDSEAFNERAERMFKLYANSRRCSWNQMFTLNSLAKEVKKNAIIGGDVLVRIKFTQSGPVVQIIDGGNVVNPIGLNGRIKNGVEVDENGRHIAYHVRKSSTEFETERIPAYTTSGTEVAFLVYGMRYRIDDTRGMPLISVVLETLSKLERYKEATVGSAEERAKIPYTIEHQLGSTGENSMTDNLVKALSGVGSSSDLPDGKLPYSDDGKALARTIATTTNKQVFNMVPGSKLQAMETKSDLAFKDFYDTNLNIICSALGIPPDVAKSMYNSNFSASRAALKDWEHVLKVDRNDFTEQFYSRVYSAWLFWQVADGKIDAPGYIAAYASKTWMIIDAYSQCRFDGEKVPHIDPVKEVTAERMKLGGMGANIPLTTVERAVEQLDSGDSDSNIQQFAEEINMSRDLGIVISQEPVEGTQAVENP